MFFRPDFRWYTDRSIRLIFGPRRAVLGDVINGRCHRVLPGAYQVTTVGIGYHQRMMAMTIMAVLMTAILSVRLILADETAQIYKNIALLKKLMVISEKATYNGTYA